MRWRSAWWPGHARRMLVGSRKKQTTGFQYLFGIHMGLCRGAIDELIEIRVGDKTAWTGSVTSSQTIQINAPDLFGGDKGEGGIRGSLDVMMGEPTQPINPRLAAMVNGLVSAARGVTSLFYDGLVTSNNPYPKRWSMRVRRATKGWDGDAWYPEKAVISLAGGAVRAMNPAHILYACLTDRNWGRGLDRGRIDDAAFRRAADTLWSEGFGLCLRWTRQTSVSEFMQSIMEYIGAAQYPDRRTGLITLRLVRGGYDAATLPLFTPDTGLLSIEDDDVSSADNVVNQVIVKWRDPRDNEVRQVRDNNLGSIQATGRVSTSTLELLGLPTSSLALRVARRELDAAAGGLKRLKIRLDRRGRRIDPAGVFRIQDLRRGIQDMVLRAVDIQRGPIDAGIITVSSLQDVFSLPSTSYVQEQPGTWTPPNRTPAPSPNRALKEATYRDLASLLDAPNLALLDPAAGYLTCSAQRPGGLAVNYVLATRVGTGAFGEVATGDWCPTAVLATALDRTGTAVALTAGIDLDGVAVGSWALVDDEIVRVAAIDPQTQTAVFARGCIDTVPSLHAAGARVWFAEDYAAADLTEYAVGQTVQAKVLTRTSGGQLAEALAPTDSLAMNRRQIRPYPPGRLRVNGDAYPAEAWGSGGVLTASWAHRDRLLQADQLIDSEQISIGPEPGTTYTARWYVNDVLVRTQAAIVGTSDTFIPAAGSGGKTVRVEVEAVRDGYRSWQAATHAFVYIARLLTESSDRLLTEGGDLIILE